ncbi:HXXXD-type acyl-transferase family protein [Striga hermonthica]|uniref:HXXXD-type acyl-transferase family protein n=1 Tax=Striga hermonthica TaxID=68872 RepID=A0A9N7NUX2_STRHE|nr:HXXXD-type acyl-transferase family protein [Striga hermonthica]
MAPQSSLSIISKTTVYPDKKSTLGSLRLSVSDLPMLSCHYIQKGVLLPSPPFSPSALAARLRSALSAALSHFPPLAGRLFTDPDDASVHILCNDAGAEFLHADASHLRSADLLGPPCSDVPPAVRLLFPLDGAVSYSGHRSPLLSVQLTHLADGAVFISCAANHAVTDGTSFWNFFNAFAHLSASGPSSGLLLSLSPDFSRGPPLLSPAVLRFPAGGPAVSFSPDAPLRERIFSFTRKSILKLKLTVNASVNFAELMGKQRNDTPDRKPTLTESVREISSFQSLCGLVWRGITRARKLDPAQKTTFRMAVNCRGRVEPRLNPLYFGNAIQSIATEAAAGDVVGLGPGPRWCAERLGMGGGSVDLEVVLAPETMAGLESDPEFMEYVSGWLFGFSGRR